MYQSKYEAFKNGSQLMPVGTITTPYTVEVRDSHGSPGL